MANEKQLNVLVGADTFEEIQYMCKLFGVKQKDFVNSVLAKGLELKKHEIKEMFKKTK